MLLDFSQHQYPEQHCQAETNFDNEILNFLKSWHSQDSFPVTTSGSTGTPKRIVHSQTAMRQSATLSGNYFNFQKGQSALLCLPVNKIAGMMMVVRADLWQLKLYTLPPKRNLPIEKLPPIDFAPLVAMQAIANFSQLHHIKTLLLGGAALPIPLQKKLQAHSTSVYLSYGMTETLSHVAMQKVNGDNATSYFAALPGVTFAVDENSRLCITAPQLGINSLQTNDIVKLLSSTSFQYIGRYDNIINSGGLKLTAESIEQQLASSINQAFYIKGTPNFELGEQVTLFIEGKEWDNEALASLQLSFENITPKQAIPRRVIFKEKFQRTTTGKLLKA